MDRPHVVTHSLLSVDGKVEGFPAAVGRYYELAAELPHDAVLSGSGTMVAAAADAGVDLGQDDEVGEPVEAGASADGKPLLVVVDSGGRLTRFDWLRSAGLWSGLRVVGSDRTSRAHRERLRAAGVAFDAVGDDRVDLADALEHLRAECGVDAVRVDAGPGLNEALLGAGLLDEVSVLLAPYLVGSGRGLVDGFVGSTAQPLELNSVQAQPDGHVWLRYAVKNG